jgi:hypothetical protein
LRHVIVAADVIPSSHPRMRAPRELGTMDVGVSSGSGEYVCSDIKAVRNAIYDCVPGFAIAESRGRDVLNCAGTWVDIDALCAGIVRALRADAPRRTSSDPDCD